MPDRPGRPTKLTPEREARVYLRDGPRIGLAALIRQEVAEMGAPLARLDITISHSYGISRLYGVSRLARSGLLKVDAHGGIGVGGRGAWAAFSKLRPGTWQHDVEQVENHTRIARLESDSGEVRWVRTSASMRGHPHVMEWACHGDPERVLDTRRVPMGDLLREWRVRPDIALNYYGHPRECRILRDMGARIVLCHRQVPQNPRYVDELVELGCRGWDGHAKVVTGTMADDGRPALVLSSMNLGHHTRRLEQHLLVTGDAALPIHHAAAAFWDAGPRYGLRPRHKLRDRIVMRKAA